MQSDIFKKQAEERMIGRLASYQLWAADQMKLCARETEDAQLKSQYEQIAAVNRMLYEKLTYDRGTALKREPAAQEVKRLLRAFFCQKALYDTLSQLMCRCVRPPVLDEMLDRQVKICRQLSEEMQIRLKTLQENFEKKQNDS